MLRHKKLGFVLGFTLAVAGCAGDAPTDDGTSSPMQIYAGRPSDPLTAPSQKSSAQIAQDFLSDHGRGTRTLDTLRVTGEKVEGALKHVQFEQQLDGMRIAGGYVKATYNDKGELLHLIDALVSVPSTVKAASTTEHQALRAALTALHPQVAELAELTRDGNITSYDPGSYFFEAPSVERVLVRDGDSLGVGFSVETWSNDKNELHETLVGPSGRILSTQSRTANESYKVFMQSPIETPATIVSNPANAVASPAGWLTGGQTTFTLTGNNAKAYLDTNANNRPDMGGVAIAGTDFVATLDASSGPESTNNKTVAVQNLFFHNNLIHDELYTAGFTEAEGNFQQNNFDRGGRARDPVNAEAQDGSGTDNANFATPQDGRSPRMQMFVWSPGSEVVVTAPAGIAGSYKAYAAAFGPPVTYTGISGTVQAVGTACTANGPLPALAGAVALIDRGTCPFVEKVKNAQLAGASATIVANNDTASPDSPISMGGEDATITISSLGVSYNTGVTLKSATGVAATLRTTSPFMTDGDLDADIVWHEYGHGLTWRMIGSMSGPMSGAVGEGMSDILALIHGDDDRIGEYSFTDSLGIRRAPYTNYPRTYGTFNSPVADREVHNDGEVYAAIGYRLIQLYSAAGVSRAALLNDLVDGMRYTPARPTFEQMRDGILASLTNRGVARDCMVWSAFAAFGVGVGATGTVNSDGSVTVVESFAKPASCP